MDCVYAEYYCEQCNELWILKNKYGLKLINYERKCPKCDSIKRPDYTKFKPSLCLCSEFKPDKCFHIYIRFGFYKCKHCQKRWTSKYTFCNTFWKPIHSQPCTKCKHFSYPYKCIAHIHQNKHKHKHKNQKKGSQLHQCSQCINSLLPCNEMFKCDTKCLAIHKI